MPRNAIIMGAAGRDFHNFNVFFRDNPAYNVVAFTAAQIPFIENRVYPSGLAGKLYSRGVPIETEDRLSELVLKNAVTDVFFSYSDVSHEYVMHTASQVLACGANFHLLGPTDTMLPTSKPVISVVAVRTGAGKSTISRMVVDILRKKGFKPVVIRHPMPYGKFESPVQRYASPRDLDRYAATVEEREELEGYLEKGLPVYAGVDYEQILWRAEKDGDLLIWDGGNNDFPFYKSSLSIVVADPVRAGNETKYHPGETNFRMADIVAINKVNIANPEDVQKVVKTANKLNPKAKIVRLRSEATLDKPGVVKGRRVLVVEDGPSITHGDLKEGAGASAVRTVGGQLVDPRNKAVGSIKTAYDNYPHIGPVLPALGYSIDQLRELEETIDAVDCEAVVLGTPADLTRLIKIARPVARVRLEAFDEEHPGLETYVTEFLNTLQG